MNHQKTRCRGIAFLVSLAIFATTGSTFAGWNVYTPPEFVGDTGIKIVGGLYQTDGATIVIQKGEQIKLSATVRDEDSYTPCDTPTYAFDPGWVIWTTSGGTLASNRTESDAENLFTAPNSTGTITITAQADDEPKLANDNPGETVTLYIKVIDGCPESVGLSSSCTGSPPWQVYLTFGHLSAKMCVAGGTPPNPPGNWNGLQITEVNSLNTNDTTCQNSDMHASKQLNTFCTNAATFSVGLGGTAGYGCLAPQADNCFYDYHGSASTDKLFLLPGHGPCNIVCNQEYFCNGTSLGKFKTTRTFELIIAYPFGTRCRATITKAAN